MEVSAYVQMSVSYGRARTLAFRAPHTVHAPYTELGDSGAHTLTCSLTSAKAAAVFQPGRRFNIDAVATLCLSRLPSSRWCTLRVLESNTASLVKVLELLKALLECMVEAGYRCVGRYVLGMHDESLSSAPPHCVPRCLHHRTRGEGQTGSRDDLHKSAPLKRIRCAIPMHCAP